MNVAPYIGLPFAWNGRGPDAFDCYGLALAIYRDAGIALPDVFLPGGCEEAPYINNLIETGKSGFVQITEPEPLAIMAFAIHPRFVSHLGIALDPVGRFIHVRRDGNVVVESLASPIWSRRLRGIYRWAG